MEKIGLALSLYSWVALAFIVILMFLIARFYQQKSGFRSYYRLFLVPATLFVLSGLIYVFSRGSRVVGFCSDALLLVGGIILIFLSRSLFVRMTGGRQMIISFAIVAWIVSLGSVIYLLLILAELSKRLGEVTKWPPYYRGLYVGAVLVALALAGRALIWNNAISPDFEVSFLNTSTARMLLDRLPMAVGVTISAVVAWRYWRWLLKDE